MSALSDEPRFKRPREKLLSHGVQALRDDELLAILLRTGYKGKSARDIAQRILKTTSLRELATLSSKDLSVLKGVGVSRACAICAAFEIGRRALSTEVSDSIQSPHDAAQIFSFIRHKKKEHLVGVYLNARNQVMNVQIISIGTLNASLIHPREVFAPAMKEHAAAIILGHNHPSGNLEPSSADVAVTKTLVEAGGLLGIDILDHLIVTASAHQSMKDGGWI